MNFSDEYINKILLDHGIPENKKLLRAIWCIINTIGLKEIKQNIHKETVKLVKKKKVIDVIEWEEKLKL